MAALTQIKTVGDWLIDEYEPPNFCREEIVVLSGQDLASGAVLGLADAATKYVAYDNDAAAGINAAHGILLAAVDATGGDAAGVAILRGPAVVSESGLTWLSTQHANDIAAGLVDLLALGIVARKGL